MTRDQLIDRLSIEIEPLSVANAVCHDAFDHFALGVEMELEDEYAELDLAQAWSFYRDGWDARGASK